MTSINLLTLPGKLWSMNGSTWKLTWLTTKLDTENSMAMRRKDTSACTDPSIKSAPSTSKGTTAPTDDLHSRLLGACSRVEQRHREAQRITKAHAA